MPEHWPPSEEQARIERRLDALHLKLMLAIVVVLGVCSLWLLLFGAS